MNTLFEKLKNQKSSRDNATGDLGINHQEQGHDPSSSSSSSAVKSSGSGSMESDAKRRSFHFKNRNKDEQDKRGKRYTVNMGRLLSRRKSVKNLQKSSGINDHRGEEDDDQEEGVKRTNQRIGILKLKNMSKVSARNNRAHVKYESVEMVEKSWKDLTAPWSTSDENERYIGEEQHGNDEEQMVHVDSCAATVDPLPIKFKTVIVVKRSSPRGALGEEEEEEEGEEGDGDNGDDDDDNDDDEDENEEEDADEDDEEALIECKSGRNSNNQDESMSMNPNETESHGKSDDPDHEADDETLADEPKNASWVVKIPENSDHLVSCYSPDGSLSEALMMDNGMAARSFFEIHIAKHIASHSVSEIKPRKEAGNTERPPPRSGIPRRR